MEPFKTKPISPDTLSDELSIWPIPTVENEVSEEEKNSTNAIGLKKSWKYEPPEEDEISQPEPLTAEEIEQIRQSAYEEGFNQGKEEGFEKGYQEGEKKGQEAGEKSGHEQGFASGLEEGKQHIDELTHQWQSLIEQLHKPLDVVEKNVEQQLFELVVQLTEAIVHQEMITNHDIVVAAVSEGIKALPSQEPNTQIYLNPADIKLVEQAFGRDHISESGWHLLPSPELSPGSCQIENSTSHIDLKEKTRIKEVLDTFLQNALQQ